MCSGYGMNLNQRELDELFAFFDDNGDGTITYDEFLHGIRGPMNQKRTDLVKQAFRLAGVTAFLTFW
jgi:hypothetical protein